RLGPGAHAPGFMLSPASQAGKIDQLSSIKMRPSCKTKATPTFIYMVIIVITLLLFPASAKEQKNFGGSTFAKNDITYSTEVVTPHVPWATKLPQGPIKSFFIPSIQYGR